MFVRLLTVFERLRNNRAQLRNLKRLRLDVSKSRFVFSTRARFARVETVRDRAIEVTMTRKGVQIVFSQRGWPWSHKEPLVAQGEVLRRNFLTPIPQMPIYSNSSSALSPPLKVMYTG